MDQARTEHREFGALFDPHEQLPSRRGTRAAKLKKLVSQILLEAIRIDRDLGMYMFDMYNKGWLSVAGGEGKVPQFNSLEEYQAYRRDDFGIRYTLTNVHRPTWTLHPLTYFNQSGRSGRWWSLAWPCDCPMKTRD